MQYLEDEMKKNNLHVNEKTNDNKRNRETPGLSFSKRTKEKTNKTNSGIDVAEINSPNRLNIGRFFHCGRHSLFLLDLVLDILIIINGNANQKQNK